jgi:hypothetical protein
VGTGVGIAAGEKLLGGPVEAGGIGGFARGPQVLDGVRSGHVVLAGETGGDDPGVVEDIVDGRVGVDVGEVGAGEIAERTAVA